MSENCSKSSGGTTNKMMGMRRMAYEERLREMSLFSKEEGGLSQDLLTVSPCLKEEGSYRNSQTPLRGAQ